MRRQLFFIISILIYVLYGISWAQENGQPGGSISGTLLMLDDRTPHVAIVVQAVSSRNLTTTTLSNENGEYRLANLKPGVYQVRCYTMDGYLYYGKDRAVDASHALSLQVQGGKTLKNIDFRFAPFKKGTWRNYNTLHGLVYNAVNDIYRTRDGVMWFATDSGGVSRYDGKEFVNLTTKDGLVDDYVEAIHCDPDGVMWFGTMLGVSRYDGRGMSSFLEKSLSKKGEYGGRPYPVGDSPHFVNFSRKDGLPIHWTKAIYQDPDGLMWFGTVRGLFRYDGKEFVKSGMGDGLPNRWVNAIHRDPDGVMWLGTERGWGSEGGVVRYDGAEFSSFTTEDGLVDNNVMTIHGAPDGVIWFGTAGGVSRYDGKEFVNFTTADGLADNYVMSIHCSPDGVMWFGTAGGVSRYDGSGFVNFVTNDGLANNRVNAIYRDPDGVMWFGTGDFTSFERGGVSRYDGEGFANFTTKDGLANNHVTSLLQSPDGVMWFGTRGGVSRYDGKEFANFTTEDGLANNNVFAVHRDLDGVMWFGTWGGGVSRYDGKEFVNFTTEDGLPNNDVISIHRAPDGALWFGVFHSGASRYDGKEFTNFTTKDGLPQNSDGIVWSMDHGEDGIMWFGTWSGGVSRYDGKEFVNFTTADGLANDNVSAIYRDSDGVMWFGMWGGGVSRYDGKEFVNFTTADGLAHNIVSAIYRDSDGVMWFGADGGGVSCYDGTAWTSLDTRDGLAGNAVFSIHQDPEGFLWFGTEGGITRYRRSATPPGIHIVSVTTDRTYRDLSAIPAFAPGVRVTIEYKALDFKTVPEKQQYRCRIQAFRKSLSKKEMDSDWRKPTKATSSDFVFDEPGTYTFEVQAIDRDLNYSEPASLELIVVQPFYLRAVFLVPAIGSGIILLAALAILATALTKRRRQVHTYQQAAVQELQDAREMQLSLLPEAPPQVEGIEIAGKSITANTVGGDFFDYLELSDSRVGIAVADVSGKGLRAAMNATMTNGMMHEVATIEASCGSILSRLNAHLYPLMERQMFTAFSFAILDPDSGFIQWANAAQPLPLIKRGTAASEIREDGEFPLGMAPDVKYTDYQLELQTGDTVIFYTDGIIEAENAAEEMYGTERLLDAVAGIDPSASAEDVIDVILRDVNDFVGDAEQYDDITIVAVKRTEKNNAT